VYAIRAKAVLELAKKSVEFTLAVTAKLVPSIRIDHEASGSR